MGAAAAPRAPASPEPHPPCPQGDHRMNQEQFDKVKSRQGFIAALDQSGGSTPKALRAYGVEEHEYDGDVELFDRIHEMRTRIMTSPEFTGDRVLGASSEERREGTEWFSTCRSRWWPDH